MGTGEEFETKIPSDVKNFVLYQIESLIFETALSIYNGSYLDALRLLEVVEPLLPPDTRRDVADAYEKLSEIRMKIARTWGETKLERFKRRMAKLRRYHRQLLWILGRIQESLYDSYLRIGMPWVKIGDDIKNPDYEVSA